jgi:hypothetical protein
VKHFSRHDGRLLIIVVALCILFASIPLGSRAVIASRPKQPTALLNICEPSQAAALNVPGIPIARPATSQPRLILLEPGQFLPGLPKSPSDLSIAPESPPPKSLI